MATTLSGFLKFTSGAAVLLLTRPAASMAGAVSSLAGTRLDIASANLSTAGFAKNGSTRLALSGTTTKAIDLTNLVTNADSYAGDVTFASFSQLLLTNDGAAAVVITPSASNGASLGLTNLTVPPGKTHVLNFAAVTVDGTHKSIDVTPTSGGSFVLLVGGA